MATKFKYSPSSSCCCCEPICSDQFYNLNNWNVNRGTWFVDESAAKTSSAGAAITHTNCFVSEAQQRGVVSVAIKIVEAIAIPIVGVAHSGLDNGLFAAISIGSNFSGSIQLPPNCGMLSVGHRTGITFYTIFKEVPIRTEVYTNKWLFLRVCWSKPTETMPGEISARLVTPGGGNTFVNYKIPPSEQVFIGPYFSLGVATGEVSVPHTVYFDNWSFSKHRIDDPSCPSCDPDSDEFHCFVASDSFTKENRIIVSESDLSEPSPNPGSKLYDCNWQMNYMPWRINNKILVADVKPNPFFMGYGYGHTKYLRGFSKRFALSFVVSLPEDGKLIVFVQSSVTGLVYGISISGDSGNNAKCQYSAKLWALNISSISDSSIPLFGVGPREALHISLCYRPDVDDGVITTVISRTRTKHSVDGMGNIVVEPIAIPPEEPTRFLHHLRGVIAPADESPDDVFLNIYAGKDSPLLEQAEGAPGIYTFDELSIYKSRRCFSDYYYYYGPSSEDNCDCCLVTDCEGFYTESFRYGEPPNEHINCNLHTEGNWILDPSGTGIITDTDFAKLIALVSWSGLDNSKIANCCSVDGTTRVVTVFSANYNDTIIVYTDFCSTTQTYHKMEIKLSSEQGAQDAYIKLFRKEEPIASYTDITINAEQDITACLEYDGSSIRGVVGDYELFADTDPLEVDSIPVYGTFSGVGVGQVYRDVIFKSLSISHQIYNLKCPECPDTVLGTSCTPGDPFYPVCVDRPPRRLMAVINGMQGYINPIFNECITNIPQCNKFNGSYILDRLSPPGNRGFIACGGDCSILPGMMICPEIGIVPCYSHCCARWEYKKDVVTDCSDPPIEERIICYVADNIYLYISYFYFYVALVRANEGGILEPGLRFFASIEIGYGFCFAGQSGPIQDDHYLLGVFKSEVINPDPLDCLSGINGIPLSLSCVYEYPFSPTDITCMNGSTIKLYNV